MHTEHHIEAPGGVEPEALDDQVAELHATWPPRSRDLAHPLGEASGYPPHCAHGMNSFADTRYDLALARLRRG